jgi:hypothetical protein
MLGIGELLKEDLLTAGQVTDVQFGSLEHAVLVSFVTLYDNL